MKDQIPDYGNRTNLFKYAKGRGAVLWAYNEACKQSGDNKPNINQIAKISGQTHEMTGYHLNHIIGPDNYNDLTPQQVADRVERYMLTHFCWDWSRGPQIDD